MFLALSGAQKSQCRSVYPAEVSLHLSDLDVPQISHQLQARQSVKHFVLLCTHHIVIVKFMMYKYVKRTISR